MKTTQIEEIMRTVQAWKIVAAITLGLSFTHCSNAENFSEEESSTKFFGSFFQMPMQMMKGMTGEGENSPWGVMNKMVDGMTDGMKLGFQGIDCFGNKIGQTQNRMLQFAGRGGSLSPDSDCSFDRIPLATGQHPYSNESFSFVDATGNTVFTSQRPYLVKNTQHLEEAPGEQSYQTNGFRVFLTEKNQSVTTSVKLAPALKTSNNANYMFVHISTKRSFSAADTENTIHILVEDINKDWSPNWYVAALNLIETADVKRSNSGDYWLHIAVSTFPVDDSQLPFPISNSIPILVSAPELEGRIQASRRDEGISEELL